METAQNNSKKFKQINVERFKENLFHQYGIKANMVTDLDGEAIQTAYDKILVIWNKDEKSQSFIKHLINAFLPFNLMNCMLTETPGEIYKCSILGSKLTSIKQVAELYSDIGMKKMQFSSKAMLENRDNLTESEMKILLNIRNKAKPEVRYGNIAVLSDKSTKFIQKETAIALQHFCANMILIENRNLLFVKHKPKNTSVNSLQQKPQKPQRLQVSIEEHIDSKSLSALQSIKEKMLNN